MVHSGGGRATILKVDEAGENMRVQPLPEGKPVWATAEEMLARAVLVMVLARIRKNEGESGVMS